MDYSTSSRKVVGLSLDFFVCLFVRLFRRMEKCMKSKGFFYILYFRQWRWSSWEYKGNRQVGWNWAWNEISQSLWRDEEEQQCNKNGLERMIAKISPETSLIVQSKGELAARSSKMWHYSTSTEKPNIEINLAKELGSAQGARRKYIEGEEWVPQNGTSGKGWKEGPGTRLQC